MPTTRAQRKTARRPTMPKRPTQPRGGEEALYTLTAATPHRAAPPKAAEHWIGREAQSRYARNQTKRLQCNLHPQTPDPSRRTREGRRQGQGSHSISRSVLCSRKNRYAWGAF